VLHNIAGNLGSTYAAIVREIDEFVSFGTVRFIHEGRQFFFYKEGRQFITDAHNLANASTSLDPGRHMWLINPPNIVLIPVT
jgi:predicted transcriptional regulator